MPVYPETVCAILSRLKHSVDASERCSSEGRAVNFDCGGFVRVRLQIDENLSIVANAQFGSNGCGYMVAAAELACSQVSGTPLTELHGLAGVRSIIEHAVPNGPGRAGCHAAVEEAVSAAFSEHRDRVVQEFAGESALICTCFGVSEDAIVNYIQESRARSVEEVSAARRAGSGCGSCRMMIQELIDSQEAN